MAIFYVFQDLISSIIELQELLLKTFLIIHFDNFFKELYYLNKN